MSTYQDKFDSLFTSVLEDSILPAICEWIRKNKDVDVQVSELRNAMKLPAAPKSKSGQRPTPKATKSAVASTTGALDYEPENACKWQFERGPSKNQFCGKACYKEGDTVYPLCKTHITTVGGHDRLVKEGWDMPEEVTLKKRSSSSSKKGANSGSGKAVATRKSNALQPKDKKREVKSYSIHGYARNLTDKIQEVTDLGYDHFAHTHVYPISENGDADILFYRDPKTKRGMFLYMLNKHDVENPIREPTEEEKKKESAAGASTKEKGKVPKKSSDSSSKKKEKEKEPEPEPEQEYPEPEGDLPDDEQDDIPDFDEEDEE
jgi:hypothetical protein